MAPSNKAASGLGRELGIDACSIDRLLLDLASGKQTLDRNTVVFVDEAGMAGFDNMEKLLEWARDTGAKLILTGDPEQLPAVARGNVLRKLTEMDALASKPDALLYLGRHLSDWDRVSRQKADWAKQASTFFSRGYVDEGLREYERRGFVHSAMTTEHLGEDVADAYLRDPAPASEKLILATTNAQVNALNQCVRERLKDQGALTGVWVLPETGMELSLGDRVVFKAPLKGASSGLKADVAKNEFGTILSVARQKDGSLNIQCRLDTPLSSGKPQIARFNSKDMEELDHAFATTVHRSQGMTVDSVIAVPGSFISKELFYVMASRHRQSLQIHMLESDKASIRVNAAKGIQKRHANDLLAVEQLPPGAKERLKDSNARLAELAAAEQSRFERIVPALKHIQGFNDCFFASDTVAFGRMVDLLPQALSTSNDNKPVSRVAKGLVVHEDGEHLYLALPDQSRLLVVTRHEVEDLLGESAMSPLRQREMELCFDPVTAKVTAAAMAGQPASPQVDWLRDDDPVLLRQQLALACGQLGQTPKDQSIKQGRTAIVDLKGHRGNNLEGLVLGLSRHNAYVLSGLEVVRVSRGEPALSALDEASALNLLGKRLRMVIRKGRAVECTGFEMAQALSRAIRPVL